MANLNIENLSNVVQTGNVEKLFGSSMNTSVTSDRGVEKEMQAQGLAPSAPTGGKTFSDILRDSVDKVNTYQGQADTAMKELIAGRSKNIHETMLTVERADTSLKLMMQVRNKILDAYREIMRMQV
jgi:flagellar hook-basal body complex protein FliE